MPVETDAAVLREVTVHYGPVRALDRFDLEIPSRGVHGLLGRNGAGKTTAIRTLAGLLALTSGTVRVCGRNPLGDPGVRSRLSILFSEDGLVPSLTVLENLQLWCGFYRRSRADGRELARKALKAFGMLENENTPVKGLSTGNRRAVAMARVFAVPADLVVLDEPTASLDPVKAGEVRNLIAEAAGNRPVLLSTHNLTEAQALCDTVTIVHRGRRVLQGGLESLMKEKGFMVRAVEGGVRFQGRALSQDGQGWVRLESELPPDQVLASLIREGNRITEFRPAGRSLDEIFLGLAREEEG